MDSLIRQVAGLSRKMGIPALIEEYNLLQETLDDYVLNAESFESDTWKAKRTQAHRRVWDVDKLKSLLPTGIYKSIVKPVVDTSALEDLVNSGKVNIADIEEALTETPNKAYVKWTAKSDTQAAAEATAEKLEGLFS